MDIKDPLEKENLNIALFSLSEAGALPVLRLLGPAKFFGSKVLPGSHFGKIDLTIVNQADIIVIQRDFCKDLDNYEQIFRLSRQNNIPVVLDIDDLLFELPVDHPDRINGYYASALLPMLQAVMEVNLVTVTTPELRDYLSQFNSNVVVIPNYLDDSIWKIRDLLNPPTLTDSITIGYMGGRSHYPDLKMVLPALINIVKKSPHQVRFKFWGIEAPSELAQCSDAYWCTPKSNTYFEFAEFFQTQTADIVIAPLCDTFFNSCKSAIKYLEYSSIGAPGVYSNVAPYARIITNRKDGFLVNSQEEWESCLMNLINDPELRRTVAINAQENVKKNWLLSKNADKQLIVYEGLLADFGKIKNTVPDCYPALKTISRQIYEWQRSILIENEKLQNELTKVKGDYSNYQKEKDLLKKQVLALSTDYQKEKDLLKKQVLALSTEVVSYANSKSWKITRPLRKISKIKKN